MTHSRKILSQAGTSLADVYDIEGSIVGLEELDAADVKAVHELGGQIHSERLLAFGLIADSTAVLQSVAWNITLGAFPDSINRVLSIVVLADNGARVDNAQVSIVDPGSGVDHIIWSWNDANDVSRIVRWNGPSGLASQTLLQPTGNILGGAPTLLLRTGATRTMPSLVFRGVSLAFGAGTVQARALIQIARPNTGNPAPGEPSSHGLPIPGW